MSQSPARPRPASGIHLLQRFSLAWGIGVLALLVLEVWAVTYQLRTGRTSGLPDGMWAGISERFPAAAQTLVVAFAATAVFGWRGFREVLSRDSVNDRRGADALWYLLAHLAIFAGYLTVTDRLLSSDAANSAWIAAWALLGVGSLTLLGLAALPAATWLQLARGGWRASVAGVGVGVAAFVVSQLTVSWWLALGDATFWLVRLILSSLTSDVVCEPDSFLIGTSSYRVVIGPPCSGYEGIGLIWVFLAGYLWLYRRSLRFPHALLLIPLGTALIWVANGLRIAVLILIGSSWSPDVAERGFHSQAGWLAFNAVGLGLVAVSHRWGFFSREDGAPRSSYVNPAAPYLAPFVALMAAVLVCAALSAGFDSLYPVRVLAVGAVLCWFWRDYARWTWSWSWSAVGLGAAAFFVWLILERTLKDLPDETAFAQALNGMPTGLAWGWLAFRVVGSVVTVPLAEELAFRGFLTRRLQAADFEAVPPGRMTWLSFLVSSVAFGLLHDRWIAGTLAGMIYAWALYRRGQLSDAVLAHAATNGLIAAYILATGTWFLWM